MVNYYIFVGGYSTVDERVFIGGGGERLGFVSKIRMVSGSQRVLDSGA